VYNRLISIKMLAVFNPEDVTLAYEESKSFVEYIEKEFGKKRVLRILAYMKEWQSINDSIQKGLSISTSDLEEKWKVYLKKRMVTIFKQQLICNTIFLCCFVYIIQLHENAEKEKRTNR
ncbi:MAG: hypothetical protein ACUVUQ_10690, partial [Thermodesulfovibrionales bacterium]